MRIVDSEQSRAIDAMAIEKLGIPSAVLMENAAVAAAELIADRFPAARRISICCGPGSNGGDGLALARQLSARLYVVDVLLCAAHKMRGDASTQLRTNQALGIPAHAVDGQSLSVVAESVASADLVVDAILGTGLSRPVEGFLAAVIECLNDSRAPLLSLDIGSGLDAGRAEIPGPFVRADLCLSFFRPKVAQILPPAGDESGELWLSRLSVSELRLEEPTAELNLIRPGDLVLPARAPQSHKGSQGHALSIAGSLGKSGAAVLVARAALRCGAGLVTTATPAAILAAVDSGCTEAMTIALTVDGDGELAESAAAEVARAMRGKQAVAIGPGLGNDEQTANFIRRVSLAADCPLVLDADGVNAFADRVSELGAREQPTILTPHPGEMARLLGDAVPRTTDQRLEAVRRAATASSATVVLKGHRSLVGTPDGRVFVNPTGNPGMATAGSGDVLTGCVAAFLAQGCTALEATLLAVFVHGLSGDLAVRYWGRRSLMAADLPPFLPAALAAVESVGSAQRSEGSCLPIGATEVAELCRRFG